MQLIFVSIFLTYIRYEIWKNSEWTQFIEKLPHQNVAAYNNMGIYYSTEGQFDSVLLDLSETMIINPRYAVSYAVGNCIRRSWSD